MSSRESNISQEYFTASINLDPRVFAATDWTTGLIRVNCTIEKYQEVIGDAEKWKDLLRCLVHEVFHVLQICALPYLYLVSTDLCVSLWNEDLHINDTLISEETLGSARISEKTRGIIAHLHERKLVGQFSLSIADIYEGAAYLADSLAVAQLTPAQYEARMRRLQGGASYYSNAFSLLSAAIGPESALALFPSISVAALSTLSPIETFSWYVENSKLLPRNVDVDECPPLIARMLPDAVAEIGGNNAIIVDPYVMMLGEAAVQPFFVPTMKFLYGMYDHETLATYMSLPQKLPKELFLNALRPLMFNDGYVIVPEHFGTGIFDDHDQHLNTIATLSMVAQRLLGEKCCAPLRMIDENC